MRFKLQLPGDSKEEQDRVKDKNSVDTYKTYKGTANIAEFLNLHVTQDAIDNNLFKLDVDTGELIVGKSALYTGTISEGKGVRRLMSIGGPISPKNMHGIYEVDNKDSAKPYRKSNNVEIDDIQRYKDPTEVFWTKNTMETVRDGAVKDFLKELIDQNTSGNIVELAEEYFNSDEFEKKVQSYIETTDDTSFKIRLNFKDK